MTTVMKVCSVLIIATVIGCATDPTDPEPEPIDPSGTHYRYVVDSIMLPHSSAEAIQYGLNIDRDDGDRVDNHIGQLLAILLGTEDYGDRVDSEIAERIALGELIHLFDVQTVALRDAERVGWQGFLGSDPDGSPDDNWPGPESYEVTMAGEPAAGAIAGGVVSAADGRLPLSIALPNVAEPIVLDLRGAAIDAAISDTGLVGTLGGAVHGPDIDRVLIPALQLGLQAMIIDSCNETGPCPTNSLGAALLDLFDLDDDGALSQQDLRESSLIQNLLSPDVDLYDDDGVYNPGVDRVKDSLSFGVRFTAVPALFDPLAPDQGAR